MTVPDTRALGTNAVALLTKDVDISPVTGSYGDQFFACGTVVSLTTEEGQNLIGFVNFSVHLFLLCKTYFTGASLGRSRVSLK